MSGTENHQNHLQLPQHHSRNDSIYSMDSFIADLPEPVEQCNENGPKFTYISPSSSSAVSLDSRKINDVTDIDQERKILECNVLAGTGTMLHDDKSDGMVSQNGRSHEKFIGQNVSNDGRGIAVDSDAVLNVAPVHSFFHQPYFQAADDGSIEFNNLNDAPPLPQPLHTPNHTVKSTHSKYSTRDRFPSYDSVGSSGSLVRNVPSKVAKANTPVGPKILPYHERMQQRQKHQQQRHSSRQEPVPPRPDRQLQQQQSNRQQTTFGMNAAIPPPPESQTGNIDMSFIQYQNNAAPSPHMYQTQNNQQLSPFPGVPVPSNVPNPGLSNFTGNDSSQQHIMHHQHTQIDRNNTNSRNKAKALNRPPSGNVSSTSSKSRSSLRGVPQQLQDQANSNNRQPVEPLGQEQSFPYNSENYNRYNQTNSSFDSSDDNFVGPDGNLQGLKPIDKFLPPPPPPPINSALDRQDSSGSVSSLGSLDRSTRDDNSGKKVHNARSFFNRLNPWATKEHNVTDFHRNNQAFLSTIERQNQFFSVIAPPSPNIVGRRYVRLSECLTHAQNYLIIFIYHLFFSLKSIFHQQQESYELK